MPFQDIMVDLETLGNNPNAAIIAIGAVAMDLEKKEIASDVFYKTVNLESAMTFGSIDASTVQWWMKQSDDARNAAFQQGGHDLQLVLRDFNSWVDIFVDFKSVKLWGNGAAFDNIILRSAYIATGLRAPWSYRNDRCYRTVKELYQGPAEFRRVGTAHNALNDAQSQAAHLLTMLP